jgi:protein TonB
MFDQTFVNVNARTRRPWTVAASLALQAGFVAVMLILPLLHPQVPHVKLEAPVEVRLLPLTTEAQPPLKAVPGPAPMAPRPVFTAPTRVPVHIAMADTIEAAPVDVAMPLPPGTSPIAGIAPDLPERAPQPAPPVKPDPVSQTGPLRVGSGVQSSKLIFGPKPHFSPLALAARIQGTVRIQAIIAVDGTMRNLRVVSGPPLLAGLALDAVKQWRYQPTLLNGTPVEVVTEIDVVFTLNGN